MNERVELEAEEEVGGNARDASTVKRKRSCTDRLSSSVLSACIMQLAQTDHVTRRFACCVIRGS